MGLNHDTLKRHLNELVKIPQEEWTHFSNSLTLKELKKGEHLFRQDEKIDQVAFLLKGLFKNYHLYPDGTEWIRSFVDGGGIAADYSALIQGTPAFFNCEALEDCTVFVMPYREIVSYHFRHPCWQEMDLKMIAKLFVASEARIYQEVSLSAKERWALFQKEHPNLLERVPKYIIARYLGITREALSRITKA